MQRLVWIPCKITNVASLRMWRSVREEEKGETRIRLAQVKNMETVMSPRSPTRYIVFPGMSRTDRSPCQPTEAHSHFHCKGDKRINVTQPLCISLTDCLISANLFFQFDSVKTRMQTHSYNSIMDCVRKTYAEERLGGFFRGKKMKNNRKKKTKND